MWGGFDAYVEGVIEAIYPQGVIVRINTVTFGICDYTECYNNSGSEKIYSGNRIKGIVVDYDEVNLWIVIEDSKVIE